MTTPFALKAPSMSAVANAAAADPVLLQRSAAGVTTLTLNRPRQYNALSSELIGALDNAFDQLASDAATRVVVITGSGSAFSAGHDLKEMRSLPSRTEVRALFAKCSRMMQRIPALPQPVIAAVNGIATAAGCQLVAQCDLAVAVESARFATSGIRYGLFCSTPAVPLSRVVPAKVALEMLMTGDFIDAAAARQWGLVNRVCAPEALDEAVTALAQTLMERPPGALARGKAFFYRQREQGLADAYEDASCAIADDFASPWAQEGVQAFIDKRTPRW